MIRSRSLQAGPAERGAAVDLAPLIDVVFILLIFFLVSTTFARDRGIDVARPTATRAVAVADEALRVQITSAGACFVEGAPVERSALAATLRERTGGGRPPALVIVPDARVDAGLLVEVMDAALTAGLTDLAVATREEGAR